MNRQVTERCDDFSRRRIVERGSDDVQRGFAEFGVRGRKMTKQTFRKASLDQFMRPFRLEERLTELQSSNRRLRVTIGALVLLGGALITMAQASPNSSETVEARQFVLRDGSGNVRGVLSWVNPEGAVGLNLDDATGRTRLTLDVDYGRVPPDWTSSIKVANAGPLFPGSEWRARRRSRRAEVNFALAWTFRAPILRA